MNNWKIDKAETDGYLQHCIRIIEQHTGEQVAVSSDYDDQKLASDLNNERCRVAVRIRRHEHIEDYGGEFTVRFSRASGAKCEWAKLISRDGPRWMLYGFRPEQAGDELAQWTLIDLDVWRAFLRQDDEPVWARHHNNADGTTFVAYRFCEMPSDLIAARSN